jgi:bacillithiol system protein YtxJ
MIRRWLRGLLNRGDGTETANVAIQTLTNPEELGEALNAPVVVLYKHSPVCAVSWWTLREVKRFAREHPDTAVFHIDVIRNRDLSDWISRHFGIRHESPQALVIREGRKAWATSHGGITADALRERVAGLV